MTFEDWIFSIHLLFAATLVGSLVMSWIVIVATRTAGTPDAASTFHRVALVATGATITGLAGVITFGLWLAVLRTEFHPWDGWVIAAIVLWLVATVALFKRTSSPLVLRAVASLAIVLIVVDMIWKPGA